MELVLSLFPGIDLLGRGFASEGFAVVAGPDLILDAAIEGFHVPAGRFDGVIGGPPCQQYSDANRTRDIWQGDELVREFLRVVAEAQPVWFLMENVRNVPTVHLEGYRVQRLDITDAECGGRQQRLRHVQFGDQAGHIIRPARSPGSPSIPAVLCAYSPSDSHASRVRAQGFPSPLPLESFTPRARAKAIGNAVSYPVATTLARAVRERSPAGPIDCPCQCGRTLAGRQKAATLACRKRLQRDRDGDGPRRLKYLQ